MLADRPRGGETGFCSKPGLTQQDIAELLAVLPSGVASGMPVIAMGGRHAEHTSTAVAASRDLLFLCGAKNLGDLLRCLAGGDEACPERFLEFTAKFNVNAPPSAERLQIRIGRMTRILAVLGRRASVKDAPPLFVGAVLDLLDRVAPSLEGDVEQQPRTAVGEKCGSRQQGPRRTVVPRSRPGIESRSEILELELRRLKANFRELSGILDTAMDGVAVLDSQGLILTLNRSGEALFSYDQHEVAGRPFTSLLAPECRPLAQEYFEELRSHGALSLLNRGREVTALARQGGTLPVFMTLARIGTPGAGRQGEARFCALLRDLTHWKKVEGELEEARKDAERANALKSDFLARVSHEIRTPLNAILGFAEVMMEERFGPIGNQRYKDYLGDIHASGALVMSLVNDLLDLSKIEAGKMDFEFISIDVNRIVSECVSIMQPQASLEQVDLKLSVSPALPSILADERSVRQIVLNLLSNAVKFNRPGGQVMLSTLLADSGSAVIRIKDTGVGMREEDLGPAFEPFRRLTTERRVRGTGLGLPLTIALVEANHASLMVKSKEYEGTLVEVVFPPARILAE